MFVFFYVLVLAFSGEAEPVKMRKHMHLMTTQMKKL